MSAALLAGNLPVYALNTAYAAEEDGFFTDETDSFEGGSQESEDTQSEDSFASVSEFTGFTSGEAEEDFQEKRTLKPLIPRRDLKGRQILSSCQKPMRRMRVATFRT